MRRNSEMLMPTAIMGALALILSGIAYQKGQGQHIAGMQDFTVESEHLRNVPVGSRYFPTPL